MKWHDHYATWDEYMASFDGLEFSVRLRDTKTGADAVSRSIIPWGDGSIFFWGEGNYGCDCNRGAECGIPDARCSTGKPRFVITGIVFDGHPHVTEIYPQADWGIDMNTGRA